MKSVLTTQPIVEDESGIYSHQADCHYALCVNCDHRNQSGVHDSKCSLLDKGFLTCSYHFKPTSCSMGKHFNALVESFITYSSILSTCVNRTC